MKIQWLQKLSGRLGQRHAFVNGEEISACRIGNRAKGEWQEAPKALRCGTCMMRVDPENAPKAPKLRGHE